MHQSADHNLPRNRCRFDLAVELARLSWTEFEHLSEAIIRQLHPDVEVIGLNRVGPESSEGVDFLALGEEASEAFQIKRQREFNAGLFRDWVAAFERRSWRTRCDRFTIISASRPSPQVIKA